MIRRAPLGAVLLAAMPAAQAELTANVGWASDYWFRGVFQHASSASAGIDYTTGGFYAGAWSADVGDGLEINTYAGWSGEFEGFAIGGGFTLYDYTGDFDDSYRELNLSFGYGPATVDFAAGEYDNFDGPTRDYSYYALTLEHEGLYGRYAGFSGDFDSDYVVLGYGLTAAELDLSLALIVADDPATGSTGETLVFGIGKTFQLD